MPHAELCPLCGGTVGLLCPLCGGLGWVAVFEVKAPSAVATIRLRLRYEILCDSYACPN